MWQNAFIMQENFVRSTDPATNHFGQDLLLGIGDLIYVKGRYAASNLHVKEIKITFDKFSGQTTAPVDIFTISTDFNINLTYNTQPVASSGFQSSTIVTNGSLVDIDITTIYKPEHYGFVLRCNYPFVLKNARITIVYVPSLLLKPEIILYNTVTLKWKDLRFVKSWSFEKFILKRSLNAVMSGALNLLETDQRHILSYVDDSVQTNTVYYYILEFYSRLSSSGNLIYSSPTGYVIQNEKGEINGVARLAYKPQASYNYSLTDTTGYIYNPSTIQFNGGKISLV